MLNNGAAIGVWNAREQVAKSSVDLFVVFPF
jgi:hypothetical protein